MSKLFGFADVSKRLHWKDGVHLKLLGGHCVAGPGRTGGCSDPRGQSPHFLRFLQTFDEPLAPLHGSWYATVQVLKTFELDGSRTEFPAVLVLDFSYRFMPLYASFSRNSEW